MALTTTTLAAACGVHDTTIRVTSAMGFLPQQLIRIDDEMLAQNSAGSSGTRISVRRGLEGTIRAVHTSGVSVATGTGADFAAPPPGEVVTLPTRSSVVRKATMTLTDAQIKALVTTPALIVSAPGLGYVLVSNATNSNGGDIVIGFSGHGMYSNVDTATKFKFALGNPEAQYATYAEANQVLTWDIPLVFTPAFNDNADFGARYNSVIDYENRGIYLSLVNPLGALTGGHASNLLTVTVDYRIWDATGQRYV